MNAIALAALPKDAPGWNGALALTFAGRSGATILQRRGQIGPLAIQRPFYPEGPQTCHAIVLHPPGGIVPGDALTLDIEVEPNAHALMTTPAATKVYRSDGRASSQTQSLHVSAGATLEWLPQETICFDGARVSLCTNVHLADGATWLGWDILCLGRAASGERTFDGECRQRIHIHRGGRPVLVERAHYDSDVQAASWGLRRASVVGTLVAASPALSPDMAAQLLGKLRGLVGCDGGLCAASVVSGVLVFRYLGNGAEPARILFEQAWRLVRPALIGRPACAPRIWAT